MKIVIADADGGLLVPIEISNALNALHEDQEKITGVAWTDTQNDRRVELIDKDIDPGQELSKCETMELAVLTAKFWAWKAEKCPLPVVDAENAVESMRKVMRQLKEDRERG